MERYQNMDHRRNSNSRNMNMEKIGFKKFIFSLDLNYLGPFCCNYAN